MTNMACTFRRGNKDLSSREPIHNKCLSVADVWCDLIVLSKLFMVSLIHGWFLLEFLRKHPACSCFANVPMMVNDQRNVALITPERDNIQTNPTQTAYSQHSISVGVLLLFRNFIAVYWNFVQSYPAINHLAPRVSRLYSDYRTTCTK